MLLPVVDTKDRIIAYKKKGDLLPSDIYRVATLWVTNSNGDVLLAQRSAQKTRDPLRWGPAVAGTVEQGETYEQNIIKEAEEELGITGYHFQKIHRQLIHRSPDFFLQWFSVTIDWPVEQFRLQKKEVAAIRWFSPATLQEAWEKTPAIFLSNAPEWLPFFLENNSD